MFGRGGMAGLTSPQRGHFASVGLLLNLRVYAASFDFAGVCRLWSDGLRCLLVYSFYPQ